MTYELICTRGPMKDRRWELTPKGVKIGRAESCEIQVKDLSAELFHCTVKLADGKPVVLNLASTKGVEVNGTYVSESPLKSADTISIGNEKFELVATDGGKGGSRSKVPIVVMLIAIAAIGVTFFMRTRSAKRSVAVEPKNVPAETLAAKEKPSDDAVTTNRVVRIVNEEVVTTNRILRIVDNVVVTNYVVEVRRNGEIVSSTALPEPEKPIVVKEVTPAEPKKQVVKQEPKPETKDKEPEVELPPCEVIDSKKALAFGGAFGGDEVRMVVNTNGTRDIIHIFTEEATVKTLVVPEKNRIVPQSGRFLVVGGGGTAGRHYGGSGGAGGVVLKENVSIAPGTAFAYIGAGGKLDGTVIGRNGEDSVVTIGGVTYTAIGGGAAGGYSGGSGGGALEVGGLGLQTKSRTGGLGHDGYNGRGDKKLRHNGGGVALRSDISGRMRVYAQGGFGFWHYDLPDDAPQNGVPNTGSGVNGTHKASYNMDGSSGIVVVRYAVSDSAARISAAVATPSFPQPDKYVKTTRIDGVKWRYIMEQDGTVTIGCHGDGSIDFPDSWTPAVDRNAIRGVVKIPSRIAGKPVARIGKGAFQGCSKVTRFVVPEGVTHCGARAFARCPALEAVMYPKSLVWLGEGQVYRSPKVMYLDFQSLPPKCDYGCCALKGSDIRVCLATPFALSAEWRNSGDGTDRMCNDRCHLNRCVMNPSPEEMKLSERTCAGFIGIEIDMTVGGDANAKRDWLVNHIEGVWRMHEGLMNQRSLSLPKLYTPFGMLHEKSALIYVATMYFKAGESVTFKSQLIDDSAMVIVDDDLTLCAWRRGQEGHSSEEPVMFAKDGWHRVAIIIANESRLGGPVIRSSEKELIGGVFYKRGINGKWRMFEANPDGSEFRVTKEDARRAIADIERAKREKM